jgi:hypothetical protein
MGAYDAAFDSLYRLPNLLAYSAAGVVAGVKIRQRSPGSRDSRYSRRPGPELMLGPPGAVSLSGELTRHLG